MRIMAIRQCDAWEPVSRGEHPLAGKRALFPGNKYEVAEGTRFCPIPAMTRDRAHKVALAPVDVERAIKDGLVKRERSA